MAVETPIVVALDYPTASEAIELAEQLDPQLCKLKVGKELFTRSGPALVETLVKLGFDVFLDLKFHDIPNTVAAAVRAAADLGVWMVNVHASGGERMMVAAREALHDLGDDAPLLIAVTVLTSMDEAELHSIGIQRTAAEQVLHLAGMTANAGLDGVVCSAAEAPMLRQQFRDDFVLVTPGIRPADSEQGDQRRIVTPQQAIANGSSYLVIGRPITRHADPVARLKQIAQELAAG